MVLFQSTCRFWLLLAVVTLVSYASGYAQTAHVVSTTDASKPDSTGAYWKLRTDYKTQSTSIRFFTAGHELIYEEELPGRYVKLTRRTIRIFDDLLDGLANRRLLDTRIDSHLLLINNPAQTRLSPGNQGQTSIGSTSDPVEHDQTFRANSVVTYRGKMVVYCTNPNELPFFVSLTDDMQQLDFFRERARSITYTRYFDITLLPVGNYKLQITHPRQTASFLLTVRSKGERYSLRELK